MPTVPLPENPSLEHLKSQAKLVRDLIRAGDDGALGMIDEFHPRLDAGSVAGAARETFKTTDAQLIVARLYGFASWQRLRDHLGILAGTSFTPIAEDAARSPADAFVVAACLDYAQHGPRPTERIAEAHRMLAADPSLATDSIASLATVGDHAGLGIALDTDPDATNEPCGPNRWPPLLYATFSRIDADNPDWSSIATVELLLARGADPNAGFLWRGLVPPFTALTGAFGGGESHQPWHPDRLELARLLLEAGADPNDGQTLYNNGLGGQNHDDPAHLELLVEYGLGTQHNGPWYRQLGDQLPDPARLLPDELEAAAKRNRPTILRYLLGLGLDPSQPVGRSQLTPARIAAAEGHDAILDVLAEHGVNVDRTPTEEALRATRSNDVAALDSLLDHHPDLLATLRRGHAGLCHNVGPTHGAMLTRLIDLGFDINDRSTTKTALHHAAEAGDTERAQLLIAHGADPNLTDTHIGALPFGWANHNGHTETAELLRPLTRERPHGGDPLPEFLITSVHGLRTLASPDLVEAYLDQLHDRAQPVLVTVRHARAALTIGLGHPRLSVALYLDHDGTPWHAVGAEPSSVEAADVAWRLAEGGTTTFYRRAYRPVADARAIATAFVADPATMPTTVEWEREGDDT